MSRRVPSSGHHPEWPDEPERGQEYSDEHGSGHGYGGDGDRAAAPGQEYSTVRRTVRRVRGAGPVAVRVRRPGVQPAGVQTSRRTTSRVATARRTGRPAGYGQQQSHGGQDSGYDGQPTQDTARLPGQRLPGNGYQGNGYAGHGYPAHQDGGRAPQEHAPARPGVPGRQPGRHTTGNGDAGRSDDPGVRLPSGQPISAPAPAGRGGPGSAAPAQRGPGQPARAGRAARAPGPCRRGARSASGARAGSSAVRRPRVGALLARLPGLGHVLRGPGGLQEQRPGVCRRTWPSGPATTTSARW